MNVPKIPSFFRKTNPKTFNFTPRFYDPVKERIENSYKKAERKKEKPFEFKPSTKRRNPSTKKKILFYTLSICLIIYYFFIK